MEILKQIRKNSKEQRELFNKERKQPKPEKDTMKEFAKLFVKTKQLGLRAKITKMMPNTTPWNVWVGNGKNNLQQIKV